MDWNYHSVQLGAQQGWQCPVCGAINAPWVMQCPCGGKITYHITYTKDTTTTTTPSTGDQTIYRHNTLTTATSPKSTTTTATSSQSEENCENCLGGCDLCYYCRNGDHYTYKGWTTTKK